MLIVKKKNFQGKTPFVTYFLLALMLLLNLTNIGTLVLKSDSINFYNLITSIFAHANFVHFLGNAFYLYNYGDNIEDVLGSILYFCMFLLLGIIANFAFIFLHSGEEFILVGASGAISGILGLYLIFFPNVKTNIVLPVERSDDIDSDSSTSLNDIPVSWSLVLWFGIQIFFTFYESIISPGIAFSAHAGGFSAGILFGLILKRIGFVDRHSEKLLNMSGSKKSILCPSCNTPKKIPGYGRYKW